MFSSELDRVQHPLPSRSRGILLGSILMLTVAAALVSSKTVAFSFYITVAVFFIAAALRRDFDPAQLRPGPVALHLAAFLLYALMSVAWAANPAVPLEKASVAILVATSTVILVSLVRTETRPNLLHMGEGLCIGLVFGLVYLLVELLTDQSIKMWLYRAIQLGPSDLNPPAFFSWSGNTLLGISKEDLTRNMMPAVLFLWPAVMVIRATWAKNWGSIGIAMLVLFTAAVVMLSLHESSKMALLVGLAAFASSQLSLRLTGRLAVFFWVFTCVAVLPATLLAYRLDLQHAPWLQASARHRVIIWNFTAEKLFDAPWFGIGANMTYVLGPELESQAPQSSGGALARTLSIHSHSIYLQTWFELGLFGAALLTLVGLSILSAIRGLIPLVQPYAYATFASAAAMAAASYGMWQMWFMASFGLTAVLFWVGASLLIRHATDTGLSAPIGAQRAG